MAMPPFVILPVHPVLSDWVESIFIMNVDFAGSGIANEYKYPWSVTTHIYFTISGVPLQVKSGYSAAFTSYPDNFVIGPRLINDIVNLGEHRRVAGITFKPGGLHRLFHMPVSEIVNAELDVSLVCNKEIRALSERLKNAVDYQEVFDHLESFLLEQACKVKPATAFDLAIGELIRHKGNLPVKTVAGLAGISMRQLERKAITALGVSPKLFGRIVRFSGAYIFKEAHPAMPWLQIAYEFGYADQMHLIDDFKLFSGHLPSLIPQQGLKIVTAIEAKL